MIPLNTFFRSLIIFALSITVASVPKYGIAATDLSGAYLREVASPEGPVTQVLLFSDGFFSWTAYHSDSGAFQWTKGGSFELRTGALNLTYEFDSADSASVGTQEQWAIGRSDNDLIITMPGREAATWKALEDDDSTPLTGAWLISGRKRNGEIRKRDTDRPRKTMKLLTGTRFQWIAYNTATGQFFGTGGGAYTAKDGVYTENIAFFSRDDSRVGASLEFQFEVQGENWRHSGKSSKGEPMYEIWTKR